MTLKTSGLDALEQSLLELAFAPVIVQVELQAIAYELRDKARDMAPKDYEDLAGAINLRRLGSVERTSRGHFVKGVSTWEVAVNGSTPVKDPDKAKRSPPVTVVGDYAYIVHEYMGWGSTNGAPLGSGKSGVQRYLMPSEHSVAEGARRGVEAGGKFMERASLAIQPTVQFRLEKAIRGYIKTLDK